ncbi:MAG TPA: RNA polymerase sporulation sigma factor SigK [Candidatus Lachnoclostridium stercoripullorum]|uniref:RNA polymerase sigma factor n=1 Tax=Candidatus Lachnoclostridium stercoripullorum TaxID=2838635 RepID=A0A9D2AWU9_9FIRM|nr:RNA polymerase sporulation sigma factor SigK [Candidatus Lachnoclostridium stercoripullorum]
MKTFPKPLTAGEEREYLGRLKDGDQRARDVLIERNMRLVAHVVKKYQGTDYDTEDLLSVGTIGLIKAVNTFKTDRGSRLATYAAKCVENEILMLLRASKKFSREVSLFEPIGVDKDGETVSLVDVIEAEGKETLDSIILDQDVEELYQAFETCLKDNEKQVLSLRYGLFGKREHTQREIAGVLGISRSYVSRIEKKAIEKLRCQFERGEETGSGAITRE